MKNLVAVCISLMVLLSCQTRQPEEPTGGRGTYEPPTSALIVISNLRNAVIEKNTQNFMLCIADPVRSSRPYFFEPSSEVGARFQALFSGWSITREQQAFLSMTSRLASDVFPNLTFENTNVAFSSPDSTVWVSDYMLAVALGITGFPSTLSGTMVLTITPEPSGLWSIHRWSDARRTADSAETTWSLLKAQLSN